MSLTLCLICKNEEQNLPRLLKSVEGVFDEICITDTGSTDGTLEAIKPFGVKVSHFEWVDDFSAARNFNFNQASSSHIMWMDSDDILTREQVTALKQVDLSNLDIVYSPYIYSPGVLVPRERIVCRERGLKWTGRIHEAIQPVPFLREFRAQIGPTHLKSADDIQKDKGRNERILRKAMETDRSPRILFYYACELWDQNRHTDAIAAFKQYLQAPDINELNAYYRLAISQVNANLTEDAIDTCLLAIRKGHGCFAEFPCIIGQIYFNQKQYQEALHWFSMGSRMSPPETDLTVLQSYYGTTGSIPWEFISLCLNALNRPKEAYEANQKALQFANSERLRFNQEKFRDVLFPGRVANRPARFSLGSGQMPTPGFRKSDLYIKDRDIEQFSLQSIPYADSSIEALYSSHSLEHLCKQDAEIAVKEWARVLRPLGKLQLRIPDLEHCMEKFRENPDWYLMTIYGAQHFNKECPQAHFHQTGFTKQSITRLLEQNGFRVDSIRNYDGWGTPSIEVFATQVKAPRVAFVCQQDNKLPNFRIVPQALNAQWKNGEVRSEICSEGVNYREKDAFVFFRASPEHIQEIQAIHSLGGKVIYHLSENFIEVHTVECFDHADLVICCSSALRDHVQSLTTTKVISIGDSYE